MAGNVWEFVADPWKDSAIATDAKTSPGRRVIRGGSFGGSPVNLRVRYRDSHPELGAGPHVGLSMRSGPGAAMNAAHWKIGRSQDWKISNAYDHYALALIVLVRIRSHRTARCAVLAAAARDPAVSVEVGRRRRAWIGQPHEAGDGAARDAADSHRRGRRARARAWSDMPFFGGRRFDVHTKRTFMSPSRTGAAATRRWWSRDGQVGTQLDAFTHRRSATALNCLKLETCDPHRLHQARRESVGMLMTRGVLLDVAA